MVAAVRGRGLFIQGELSLRVLYQMTAASTSGGVERCRQVISSALAYLSIVFQEKYGWQEDTKRTGCTPVKKSTLGVESKGPNLKREEESEPDALNLFRKFFEVNAFW